MSIRTSKSKAYRKIQVANNKLIKKPRKLLKIHDEVQGNIQKGQNIE